MHLLGGRPVQLPVIALTKPPVQKDRVTSASESNVRGFDGPGQVGAEHRGDPVVGTADAKLLSLYPVPSRQTTGQPACRAALLVVYGSRVRLEDDLNRHAESQAIARLSDDCLDLIERPVQVLFADHKRRCEPDGAAVGVLG